jgi:serine/threonine-protein kinase
LVWLDRTGATVDTLPIPDAPYSAPRLSPDGQRIAYARTGLSQSLWQYDLVRQVPTRILIHEPEAWQPMWSADGRRLLYSDERRLFTVPVDGATSSVAVPGGESEAAIVREYPGPALPGRDAFLISRSERGVYSVWLLELSEGRAVRTPVLKLTDPADESGRLSGITYPAVSPDGRWLAYASTESGPFAVHVCRFPSMRDKQRLSSTSGRAPVWRRDGRELFYLRTSPQAALMALTVNPDTGSFGPPHILFTLPEGLHSGTFAVPAYDAAPDGQRFLFVRRPTSPIPPPPSEMRVVFNWFEELKAKVPTGRR